MPEIGTIKESSWSQIGRGCLKSYKKLVFWARREEHYWNTTTVKTKNCNAKSEGGSQGRHAFCTCYNLVEKSAFWELKISLLTEKNQINCSTR